MNAFKQPRFYLHNVLSAEHLNFFRKHGFIHFKNFISQETVRDFLREIRQVQEHLIGNNIDKVNGVPLKFGQDVDGSLFIQRIAFTSQYSRTLSEFLKDPRLQSLLHLLWPFDGRIGENEKDGLVVNQYVNTKTSALTQLGWHTDSPRDLFLGGRILPMLNVGLHLDDCPRENGGLRILPGTHTQNLFQLLFRKKYFVDNKADKNEWAFDIEAGDLTIHDGRLWHRVQQSPFEGEKSRRRVMYIPVITGAYQPKTAESATPFYHKLARLKSNPNGHISWTLAEGKTAVAQRGVSVQ
ncbi:phytanoyl-CoA dioxygenase family protein [Paraflavisolibacter sp. H34]|uniref:phytanoyl-CoA dioxygenase family protein n=1 Tax=Huijunlia imazamoxiresistens TaxID=3127457 RepID=UPI0030188ABE